MEIPHHVRILHEEYLRVVEGGAFKKKKAVYRLRRNPASQRDVVLTTMMIVNVTNAKVATTMSGDAMKSSAKAMRTMLAAHGMAVRQRACEALGRVAPLMDLLSQRSTRVTEGVM